MHCLKLLKMGDSLWKIQTKPRLPVRTVLDYDIHTWNSWIRLSISTFSAKIISTFHAKIISTFSGASSFTWPSIFSVSSFLFHGWLNWCTYLLLAVPVGTLQTEAVLLNELASRVNLWQENDPTRGVPPSSNSISTRARSTSFRVRCDQILYSVLLQCSLIELFIIYYLLVNQTLHPPVFSERNIPWPFQDHVVRVWPTLLWTPQTATV